MRSAINSSFTILTTIFLVFSAFALAPADTVIFQDFEAPVGWNGGAPPANWEILDNGAADGIWDNFDWYRSPSWGGYTARINGASEDYYNNDLIVSPSVDFSAATACTLFYRHYYIDHSGEDADSAFVMLSSDGGSTWGDTVVVYVTDFGGPLAPDSEYFDISSFAAGEDNIKVAFHYVKRLPVLVASWRIDDIKFSADGSLMMHQDFESSWGPFGDNPPANWTISDLNVYRWDDNDWHRANFAGWGNIAYIVKTPFEQQNDLLISESMDFSDTTNDIILTFKHWYDDNIDNTDTALVLGSVDGGITWAETLAVFRGQDRGSSGNPAYDTLSLLDWANYESNVKVAFNYIGNFDLQWYLDSVRVDRNDMFASDVAAFAIISPPSPTIQGYGYPITVEVENAGLNQNSFDVFFSITDSTGAPVYDQSEHVDNLQSLEHRIVNFVPWTPAGFNNHDVTCFTWSVSDMDRSNDSIITSTITYPHTGSDGPIDGWFYNDNVTGGGPAYNWIDIRQLGTQINFGDSDNGNSGMIDIGISFEYYNIIYNRIAVSVDGWLSFLDSTSSDNSQSVIPDLDGPGAMIALLWNDLHLRTGRVLYYTDVANNRFVVQYDSVEYASIPGSDIGMEVILDGDDGAVIMQYRYFIGGSESDVTVGVEDQTESTGLPYNNNGQVGQTPQPGLAITYTFLLPHEIKAVSIDQPTLLIHGGNTYDIVALFRNFGANTESFDVTAYDNFGYSNTQAIADLASLDSVIVTFPGWSIANECSTYSLTVFADLASDLNRSNDTLNSPLVATNPSNASLSYDDGRARWGEYSPGDVVLATSFEVLYEGAIISAVGFKFLNDEQLEGMPDTTQDSVNVFIYEDSDDDGIPNLIPTFESKVLGARTGWTIWNVACETTISMTCNKFWAGYSNDQSPGVEVLGADLGASRPDVKWAFDDGSWVIDNALNGDFMIRAFLDADSSTAPNLVLGESQLFGEAPVGRIDTASTYIQNTGTACDLVYRVSVFQTPPPESLSPLGARRAIPRHGNSSSFGIQIVRGQGASDDPQLDPPIILDFGGPDLFGHTWKDSDEPGGPEYYWIDITSDGSEVSWDYGSSNDGYTDPIPMGMTFNYYGVNYDSIVISTNGWVSFLPSLDSFGENSNFPVFDELNALLAVDWDNLDGGAAGRCYYYQNPNDNSFIVSWIDWAHYPAPTNQHSFQVILDGENGNIVYQYGPGTYQNDITIGIENETGDDGLVVTFNQAYLHPDLAILFSPPKFWLSTDLADGVLGPLSSPAPFNVFMSASGLPVGFYNGAIVLSSNDVDEPVKVLEVQLEVEGICDYLPGDVNDSHAANGVDVTFMVGFFKGGENPPDDCVPCSSITGEANMLYPQGDVNGNCSWNGVDVTYFVAYLKGIGPPLRFCNDCPPVGGLIPAAVEPLQPILIKATRSPLNTSQ